MRTSRGGRGALAALTAAPILVGVIFASAAPAAAATSHLFRNSGTAECLDSNSNGSLYTNACSSGNNFQRYSYVSGEFGYLIKDFATGRCLDSNANGNAYTNACGAGNAYQNWQRVNVSGSTFELQDIATGYCLRANTSGVVSTTGCNSGTSSQRWSNP